jgi:hypothetical protein
LAAGAGGIAAESTLEKSQTPENQDVEFENKLQRTQS